jgi:hypothetical protein
MNSTRVHLRMAAVLLLVLCAATALAAPKDGALRSDLSGFAEPVFNPDGSFSNTVTAFGRSPRIGNFFLTTAETSQVSSGGSWTVTGTFTIDGKRDEVITGTFTSIVAGDSEGFANSEGTYTITGGTGRYVNARGTGSISGRWRLNPPFEYRGELNGTFAER